jgi:hypothetical protein
MVRVSGSEDFKPPRLMGLVVRANIIPKQRLVRINKPGGSPFCGDQCGSGTGIEEAAKKA